MNFKLVKVRIILLISVYFVAMTYADGGDDDLPLLMPRKYQNKAANRFNRKNDRYSSLNKKVATSYGGDNYFSPFISNKNGNNKFNSYTNTVSDCPVECVCTGLSIDCSYRELTQVPKNIPKNVIKV